MRAFSLDGVVQKLLWAPHEQNSFETVEVQELVFDLGGIPGDRHYGFARLSDKRHPHYPPRTQMLNLRSVSGVSIEELAKIAERLGLPIIKPEWLGANLLFSGVPDCTFLPPLSTLRFPSGAELVCMGQNYPCKAPGKVIAKHCADFEPATFATAAVDLRGILLVVQRPGVVARGDQVKVLVPRQTVYAIDTPAEG